MAAVRKEDAVRTWRPALPLPLHALGLLAAVSSAVKSSPGGGQAEGGSVFRLSQETAPCPPRLLGALRHKKLKSPLSGEE